jgi:hypothetical protein
MVDESGTTLMLHIFKPNSFFPATWVVNDEPNRYYLEAVTPVELWRASKKAVRETASVQVATRKKLRLIRCRWRQLVIPSLRRLEKEIARQGN